MIYNCPKPSESNIADFISSTNPSSSSVSGFICIVNTLAQVFECIFRFVKPWSHSMYGMGSNGTGGIVLEPVMNESIWPGLTVTLFSPTVTSSVPSEKTNKVHSFYCIFISYENKYPYHYFIICNATLPFHIIHTFLFILNRFIITT